MSSADVFGVRLYMDVAQARAALAATLPGENGWQESRVPCAGERPAAGATGSCLASAVLRGPVGVVLRFVEDLPSHPRHSIVVEVVVSEEPRGPDSKRLFHQALLRRYGAPDLRDPTGMQWGEVSLAGGRRSIVRTRPMLESSNDEIIRLSDTGLEERAAALAAARFPLHLTAGPDRF